MRTNKISIGIVGLMLAVGVAVADGPPKKKAGEKQQTTKSVHRASAKKASAPKRAPKVSRSHRKVSSHAKAPSTSKRRVSPPRTTSKPKAKRPTASRPTASRKAPKTSSRKSISRRTISRTPSRRPSLSSRRSADRPTGVVTRRASPPRKSFRPTRKAGEPEGREPKATGKKTPSPKRATPSREATKKKATPSRSPGSRNKAPIIITSDGRRITPSSAQRRPEADLERQRSPKKATPTTRRTIPTASGRSIPSRPGAGSPTKGISPIGRAGGKGAKKKTGGARRIGDPIDPLNRDRLRKRRDDMTRVPYQIEPRKRKSDPGSGLGDSDYDGDHGGNYDDDHDGYRDGYGDGYGDGYHDRDRDCYRLDHSSCNHGYWHWDNSWGIGWSHRSLYRYNWFAGSYFDDFYGFGLRISYHGSYYYNPWYSTRTVVYVSPRYPDHVYYGVDHDTTGDAAVFALEQGWEALEYRDWTTARRRFARASSLAPSWGLPRIGYAIASAAGGNTQSAARLMVQAFERDPFSALEIPWSDPIINLMTDLEAYYTQQAGSGYSESRNWFMVAALRLTLNDPEGAADAAFAAETAGNDSDALQGLLDVLSGHEWVVD